MFVMANGNMEKVVDCKGQPYGRDNEEQSNLEVIDKHEEERKEKMYEDSVYYQDKDKKS